MGRERAHTDAGVIDAVVVSRQVLARHGLCALLDTVPGVHVLADHGEPGDLVGRADEHRRTVAVIHVPGGERSTRDDLAAIVVLRRRLLGAVVVSDYRDPVVANRLLEQGADGMSLLHERRLDAADLELALRRVVEGGAHMGTGVVDALVSPAFDGGRSIDRVTPRQWDVMDLIAAGWDNATISERLAISPKTLDRHVNSLYSTLRVNEPDGGHRRVRAVLRWQAAAGARPDGGTAARVPPPESTAH